MTSAVIIAGEATDITPLSKTEVKTLAQHEAAIEKGVRSFVEVGLALQAIRDGRLYRATHGTFEAYVADRWDFARPTAYRYITAAQVSTKLDTPLPSLEHARLIGLLPEDMQAELAPKVAAMNRAAATDFVRNYDRQPADRVRAVKDLLDDGSKESWTFGRFRSAVEGLDITQLPDDELAVLAGLIQSLVNAYKAERAEREERAKERK